MRDLSGRNMRAESQTTQPCAHCPWRTANQGKKPDPYKFYTLTNLRRLWGGLKRGERMTCHPTDPAMAEFEGYEKTAARKVTNECAGALVLIQRELQRAQDAMEAADAEGKRDGIRRYRRAHPKGLTRDGVAAHFQSMMFGSNPLTGLNMPKVNLNEPGIGHPDLEAWEDRA